MKRRKKAAYKMSPMSLQWQIPSYPKLFTKLVKFEPQKGSGLAPDEPPPPLPLNYTIIYAAFFAKTSLLYQYFVLVNTAWI